MSCFWITVWLLFLTIFSFGAGVDVGQYDNPRDLTLKIHDPYAQENADLMQPVIGDYSIRIIPPYLGANDALGQYHCEGLYFKQVGKIIYIDIRKPPRQLQAGEYDLAVSLAVPGEPLSSNRLRRHIIYTDSATDVLLVVDNSRSMKKNDPRGLRFQACQNFIQLASLSNTIQNISIVKFSGSAKVVLPWSSPSLAKKKNVESHKLSSRTGNFTNINRAFELSAELFEDSVAAEKVVVLLTDGRNEPDIYRDTHELLKDQGVRVYTVGLSDKSDAAQLYEISKETGGEFFRAVDDSNLIRIYNKIAQSLSEAKVVEEGRGVTEGQFSVTSHDDFVDINVYNFNREDEIEILDDLGNAVGFHTISGRPQDASVLLRLSNPRAGRYLIQLSSRTAFSYDVSSVSQLYMKMFPLEKKYLRGELAHFAVSLARRQTPMVDAQVEAVLSDVSGKRVGRVRLYDDGVHGDNHANDGVYCAIYPLDLPEGAYQINVVAQGKTSSGERFQRIDGEQFEVLDAGQVDKDYFLASVLPLYLDYGDLEQGAFSKVNLRVSFEGRGEREVRVVSGENLVGPNGEQFPWEAFEFPADSRMAPSQPEVKTIKLNVPHDVPEGQYSGSVVVLMGDQEIWIPLDLMIKAPALAKQELFLAAPRFPKAEDGFSHDHKRVSLLPTPDVMIEDARASQSLPLPKFGPSEVEPEDFVPREPDVEDTDVKVTEEEVVPSAPISFEVQPKTVMPFELVAGQYASMVFKLKNTSNFSGNIQVNLDGMGQMESTLVHLGPGEEMDWAWGWDAVELDGAPIESVLTFSNASHREMRTLRWRQPPPVPPIYFYVTVALLSGIALIYGLKYAMNHSSGDAYVSVSALLHLIVVVWAFFRMVIPPADPMETSEPIVYFEMLEEELFDAEDVQEQMLKDEDRVEMREQEENAIEAAEMKRDRLLHPIDKKMLSSVGPKAEPRQVAMKALKGSLPEQQRQFAEQEPMLPSAVATVISVNDRPWKRATLKKAQRKVAKAKVFTQHAKDHVLVRQRSKVGDTVQAKALKLRGSAVEVSLPQISAPKETDLVSPELKLSSSSLDASDHIKGMTLREQSSDNLTPVEEFPPDDSRLVESDRQALQQSSVQVSSSANVQMRPVRDARLETLEPKRIAKAVVAMLSKDQGLNERDTLASLEVREAESGVQAEEVGIEMDYNESNIQGQRMIGSVDARSSSPVPIGLPKSRLDRRLRAPLMKSPMEAKATPEPSLVKNELEERFAFENEDIGSSIVLDSERNEVSLQAAEFADDREVIAKGISRQQTNFKEQKIEPEALVDRSLERGLRRSPIIREGVRGKIFRTTLPSRMSPIKRSAVPSRDISVDQQK